MKIAMETVCDILVNSYDHIGTVEGLVEAIEDNAENTSPEFHQQATKLSKDWVNTEYLTYCTTLSSSFK